MKKVSWGSTHLMLPTKANDIATTKQGKTKPCPNDDVINWKHFTRYWPFVRVIQRLPVNSPHKGQWRGALMFSLICTWINGWVNNRKAGDLILHRAHYGVTVIQVFATHCIKWCIGNVNNIMYSAWIEWKIQMSYGWFWNGSAPTLCEVSPAI